MIFSESEKETIISLTSKINERRIRGEKVRVMSFEELFGAANSVEKEIVGKILSLRVGKPHSSDTPPANLVHIEEQRYWIDDKSYSIWHTFMSTPVFEAFSIISGVVEKHCEERLIAISGYRSNAFQTELILENLILYDWNIEKTLSVVELPGMSEHNRPVFHAIDLICHKMNSKGKPHKNVSVVYAFEKTHAFSWLKEHGHESGFYLSFPENNNRRMIYEPWHWLYCDKTTP